MRTDAPDLGIRSSLTTIVGGLLLVVGSMVLVPVADAQGVTTIHVEIEGGPEPGTYDLATQAPCTLGTLAPGTWSVDAVDATTEPSRVSLTVGTTTPEYDGMYLVFGDPFDYSGPFYRSSGSRPVDTTLDDRGDSVTITMRADWLEAYAADGTDMSGASALVAVVCRSVTRMGDVETAMPMPDQSPAPAADIDSLPPGTPIATGTVTWTLDETYENPDVPESSHTSLTMAVEVALYEEEGRWLDAGSEFTITGLETRADLTSTDATGKSCTITGYAKVYDGTETFAGSPWIGTEYQPMITFELDPAFGGSLAAWGSAGTHATWTEVGDKCDPPGPREESGRVLYAIWCRPPEDRLRTLGSIAADGGTVDMACTYSGREQLSGNAWETEAVTVTGIVRLGTR